LLIVLWYLGGRESCSKQFYISPKEPNTIYVRGPALLVVHPFIHRDLKVVSLLVPALNHLLRIKIQSSLCFSKHHKSAMTMI
jgi:hypothetical protein